MPPENAQGHRDSSHWDSARLLSANGGHQTPPRRLLAEVRDAINKARADRGEEPIDEHGRTPDGKQAYRLAG